MGSFHVNFLDLTTDSTPVVKTYERFFLRYNPDDWLRGSGGGSFVHVDDHGQRSSLVICNHPQHGLSMMYRLGRDEWISVGDQEKIDEFIIVPDDILLPLGSFVMPSSAWGAVKSYVETPQELPGSIQWIDSKQLNWPSR